MANKHAYYMPQGAHEFLEWARNFIAVARANSAAWQNERGTKGRFSDVEVHVIP